MSVRHATTVLLCWALLAPACSAEDPPTGRYDLGLVEPDQSLPDGLAECPSPAGLTISLDSHAEPTCQTLQVLRGSAPGADRIVVQGGPGAAQPATVGSDGRFCLEVPLTPDSQNTLTLFAVDAGGCPGQSLVHTVEHRSCDQPDTPTASVNAALGAGVTGSSPNSGDAHSLVDGKLETEVTYKGGSWGFNDASIKIDIALPKQVELERIIVRWKDSKGNGCNYAADYEVAISDSIDPGKVGDGPWTQVVKITDGDGGEDNHQLTTNPKARHVGLVLKNNGCSTWSESFTLLEVEVWATDPAVQVPSGDRCQ